MENVQKFKTFIKKRFRNARSGEYKEINDYCLGRIIGIQDVICNSNMDIAYGVVLIRDDNGNEIGCKTTAICTEEKYERFKQIIERHYPELCEFDVE